LKLQRIISLVTLAISVFTLYLVMRKPAPLGVPTASPAEMAVSAQSFQEKVNQLDQPRVSSETQPDVHITTTELSAALARAEGVLPTTAPSATSTPGSESSGGAGAEFPGPVPNVKDYQVTMDGDIVKGQFLTQIAGKDVYVTLAGHLGAKDGYATFDATEAKVGDLSVPVSLINDALQKKLMEQKDQLKLPDNVKDLRVENGELVLVPK
jgi:hypothetical protein